MGQVLGNPVLDAVTTCQCSKVENSIQKNRAIELPRKEAGYEPMLKERQRFVAPEAEATEFVEEEDYSENSKEERDLEVQAEQSELRAAHLMFKYTTDIRAPLVVVEEGENEDEDLSVQHGERPMSFYNPVAVSMGPGNKVENEMSPEMLRNILGRGYDCDSNSAASDDENVREHENEKTATESRAIMSLQTCVPAYMEEEHAQYYGTKIQKRRSVFDRKHQQDQADADAEKRTATNDDFLFHDSGVETSKGDGNDEDVLSAAKQDSESVDVSVSDSGEEDVYMRKPRNFVQSQLKTSSKSLSPLEQMLRKPLDAERKISMASANSLKWE